MKVVIAHDWLTGFRGGERVLEIFCEMFPDAPLYTLIHVPGSVPKIIENRKIKTSFLNVIPGISKHYRKFLPLFPLAARSLRITEDVDLVLSSSHCVIKGLTKPKELKHISYIYSPMRYLYDQYDSYFGIDSPWYQRWGMKLFRRYLTRWDINSNKNVDNFIAISEFVQSRIQDYYGRDSEIVYPFVDLKDFASLEDKNYQREDYYLMVSAFAPNKKVDLAVRTFNKIGKKLKIIGGGQDEDRLRSMANENIEFLGTANRDIVVESFAKARAFIFPGVEDFGITPLESLASGTPVIAYKKGGVLETLNDDVAYFFEEQSVECLSQAIYKFEEKEYDVDKLRARAKSFSKERFKDELMKKIKELM
jgi:glycosyltransferase involved in cell wall biosynthesis